MMRFTLLLLISTVLGGCSMDKILVRSSTPLIEGGIYALNQETDLLLAENAIPTNINMLEGMIHIDPDNDSLRIYAAQAYYGLGYGFNEDNRPKRAVNFYMRGLKHGLHALSVNGYKNIRTMPMEELETMLAQMDDNDVGAVFWTASNWAKWIDNNRDRSESLIELPKPTALMQRVLELDDTFYYGGAHMYFGVFYGGRSPMFGGDFKKAEAHFDRAREITDDQLLVADLLQAQYLSRQKMDREDFHNRLTKIINAPEDLNPDLALLNNIAKRKAKLLLKEEDKWF
ncbi:MAG: TRAP transporter TatT component family protein [Gammaproteobacteria bacterium]|nr:TRAP transporter TatT component family protein [Gammaproteobacteria bacterium]